MNFIDEEDVSLFQIGEHCCQITGFFNDRSRSTFNIDPHLLGNNIGQSGLPQTGRTKEKDMIKGFLTFAGCINKNLQVPFCFALSHVFLQ